MKQAFTINGISDLRALQHELSHLVEVVREANGKYVLFVNTSNRSPATHSMFISKSQFDAALSPAMRTGSPRAFSPHIANGQFLPHRLDAAYSGYQRAQARIHTMHNLPSIIRSRQEYFAIYKDKFGPYPTGRIGEFLNHATHDAIFKNRSD